MRNLASAILLFFWGLLSGAWFMGTKSVSTENNQNEFDMTRMRQMEASLRLVERDLQACRSRFELTMSGNGFKVPSKELITDAVSSSVSSSASSLSEKGHGVTDNIEKLRLEYLDKKIDDAPEDLEWTGAVDTSVFTVLTEWPGSEQKSIRCSHYVCRVEIRAGRADQAEKIIDGLNNIAEVHGERMIQFDQKNENAVVYFGRSGAISLLSGDGF